MAMRTPILSFGIITIRLKIFVLMIRLKTF